MAGTGEPDRRWNRVSCRSAGARTGPEQPRIPEHHDNGAMPVVAAVSTTIPKRPVGAVGSPLVRPPARGAARWPRWAPSANSPGEPRAGHRGGDGPAAGEPDRRRRQLPARRPGAAAAPGAAASACSNAAMYASSRARGGRLGRLGEAWAAGRGPRPLSRARAPLQRALLTANRGWCRASGPRPRPGRPSTSRSSRTARCRGGQVLEARDQRQPQAVPAMDRDDRPGS